MATLLPFRALRPEPPAAGRVAAVPYDVVTTVEARGLAADPFSFLHVSRPEIDLPDGTPIHSDAVYAKARENFDRLRAAAPLVVEEMASVYVYRLSQGTHTQTGVAACYSVAEYESGVIKRHELTRVDKEDDRTRHVVDLRAQTGPVFLTYRARPAVDDVVRVVTGTAPLFDVEAVDGVRHVIWRAGAAAADHLVAAFTDVATLYIADGHHRAASAARARRHYGGTAGKPGPWDGFLAVAFPDREMHVLPYNRLVKDLAGMREVEFLERLRGCGAVSEGGPVPGGPGRVSVFLGSTWHRTGGCGARRAGCGPHRLVFPVCPFRCLAPRD